jgi:hypothetical protein
MRLAEHIRLCLRSRSCEVGLERGARARRRRWWRRIYDFVNLINALKLSVTSGGQHIGGFGGNSVGGIIG